ncbi:BMC domain-containing protein [Caloramator sp. E03]|uniref:BMC domain-containing protein n=1 Tax=Caloramator sp. E03 TaxID=2576307 RepID=UPI0011105608|nr:BMC domain-containing protein [Caloramator sp. E03]QCX33959.1 BMC domain-containing protein [Caloramator sp. E03]
MKSIGLLEIQSLSAAIEAIDAMLKTANVQFLTWEKKLGGRLVTVVISGEVSSVKEAIEIGMTRANMIGKVFAHAVIPNPHEEVMKMIEISAKKLNI